MTASVSSSPVDVLVSWLNQVPESVAGELGRYVLILAPEGWFPQLQSVEDAERARDWIVKHLATWQRNQHANVGGTLGVAAIIDFVISTRSTPERWADLLDRNSRFLFRSRAIGSSLQDMLLKQRRRDEALAPDWMRLASSWAELRNHALSTESIETWARNHFACFMGIGEGPADFRESNDAEAPP